MNATLIGVPSIGAPGFHPICSYAFLAPSGSENSSGLGICSEMPTDWPGLMPQVTVGAMEAPSITVVSNAAKADILVEARVEVVSGQTQQMFGTTFVIRTYSVELSGESARDGRSVPMPPMKTFSFDSRVGQEKLDGETRVIAASAAERVRSFWK